MRRRILRQLALACDAVWEWTSEREERANRAATLGLPPCDGRCAFVDDSYPNPSPLCAALEASWRFRFWRAVHTRAHNWPIRVGLHNPDAFK